MLLPVLAWRVCVYALTATEPVPVVCVGACVGYVWAPFGSLCVQGSSIGSTLLHDGQGRIKKEKKKGGKRKRKKRKRKKEKEKKEKEKKEKEKKEPGP
jgi:hypothetical protein